jgi:exodeoxyribonuclease VII small subunit
MALRKRSVSEVNFEDSLAKLESIVKRLEEEEIPLETSLKLFAEGQTLAQACERQLRAAENQIRQLVEKSSGKIEEAEFEPAGADEAGEAGEAGGESLGGEDDSPMTAE